MLEDDEAGFRREIEKAEECAEDVSLDTLIKCVKSIARSHLARFCSSASMLSLGSAGSDRSGQRDHRRRLCVQGDGRHGQVFARQCGKWVLLVQNGQHVKINLTVRGQFSSYSTISPYAAAHASSCNDPWTNEPLAFRLEQTDA